MTAPLDVLLAATLDEAEQYKRTHPEAGDWHPISVRCGTRRWQAVREVRNCYVTPLAAASPSAHRPLIVMRRNVTKTGAGGQVVYLGEQQSR